MPYAVGRMYVKKNFNENAKEQVTYLSCFLYNNIDDLWTFYVKAIDMIENIRAEFKTILKEIDWMDQESKTKAAE
jgi:predicted metalloendopeptidase